MGTKYASMFLGFEQMVVQERTDGKCVCKGNSIYQVESMKGLTTLGKIKHFCLESSSPFGLHPATRRNSSGANKR